MRLRCVSLPLLITVFSCFANAQVRVWQGTLTLPTYQEGPPDPNPPFDIFQTTRFNYPYTLRETLTDQRVNESWRAIYLENEYLKCTILPDIGGHVYTCIDKVSGKPMFYANPSIKKAQIGYRGAWAAFGIEFNFPVSHNWVSMSPVDFAFKTHPDGSASVTVGNIDRVYGMEWTVELLVRPGSTVLEERVRLSNRSDTRHRFYWWNNAGVEAWNDSHIEYPTRYAASHGFTEVQPWPIDSEGKDLSVIRNQTDGPVSLFVHGSREPFMAVWHPHTKAGVAHFADYAQLPAKKIWSWGVDAEGLDWRRALSDNNSAYVEVQAGLFRNQETYAFLEPRSEIQFSEYWMPVRDIGGISRANLTGVVNLSRRPNTVFAGFNANLRISHANIRLLDGTRVLLEDHLDVTPERTWQGKTAIPEPNHKITFELRDGSGAVLLAHTEGTYDWTPVEQMHVGPQPSFNMPAASARTEDDWVQLGGDEELNGKTLQAFSTYEQALARFPKSLTLHTAAGRVAACLMRYDDALPHLTAVVQRDVSDPEVYYYLGIAYDGVGDARNARDAFEHALRFPQFRAAAAVQLAELTAREGQLTEAREFLEEALDAAPEDLRTGEELVAVRHALGETDAARKLAKSWFDRYPLSYFLREELDMADLQHLGADPYRVLNIATEYMRLGLYDRALRVLSRSYPASPSDQSEPGTLLPQNHPLVAYFRAYCQQRLGENASAEYAAASKLSTSYVFPEGAQTLEVLREAVRTNSSDATAHYLLGTLLFSRGLTDAALNEWKQASTVKPDLPVVDADIGRALLVDKRDAAGALAAFQHGITVDRSNSELYLGLDQALSILKHPATERVRVLEKYPDPEHQPSFLVYELALNRAEAGDFNGARAVFHNRFFPREEGGTNVRQVWIEVHLEQALSLARTGHCNEALAATRNLDVEQPGFPFTRDGLAPLLVSARTQYLLGMVNSECGVPDRARSYLENAAKRKSFGEIAWAYAAAIKLGTADSESWKRDLLAALHKINIGTSSMSSSELYTVGLLQKALGMTQEANASFREALLLADEMMAHHFVRLAWADSTLSAGSRRQ